MLFKLSLTSKAKQFCLNACSLALIFISIQLSASEANSPSEIPEQIVPYQVMFTKDYRSVTGCKDVGPYIYSVKNALNFLVFSEYHNGNEENYRFARDLLYTHRHSRQFFQHISKDKSCQQPSLMRMAKELQILDLNGSINEKTAQLKESTKKIKLHNTASYYAKIKTDQPIFEVLSRMDYINSTECLVSPSTYHKFHLALFQTIDRMNPSKAKKNMASFLNDVASGRHDSNGLLAKQCLNNSVRVLAEQLELLDAQGNYRIQ